MMVIEEMTNEDCREILTRISLGRLGCSYNGQPYVLPLYFVYENNNLYGYTTEGQKTAWMRANPKVCVEFDETINHFQWTSVVICGHYRELPDLPPYAEEHRHARKLLTTVSRWWEIPHVSRAVKSKDELILLYFRIEIGTVTGRRTATRDGNPVPAG
jgi:nitroimidazol reductase NimA-like FMN-containing flavoprotein (pyridoxamine 5'-phosphate oxidase superfamily)